MTVTTVVPGLMRTGSHVRAKFAGRKDEEFTWFSLGASLPLEDAPRGYEIFRDKAEGCLKVVLQP